MATLKIQFNHPGQQKPYKPEKGYARIGDNIIREWNKDNKHYRKFLSSDGNYVNNLQDSSPHQGNLFFWGEWEGSSFFTPFAKADNRVLPNGIHQPFHSTVNRGSQNTDPYVFGKEFKYCICKQTGAMRNLLPGSLILFGATYPALAKFYIDTVFVVGQAVSAAAIRANRATGYSRVYKEETLEQLEIYLSNGASGSVSCAGYNPKTTEESTTVKLYHGQIWSENKDYFSFVPCKTKHDGCGFERMFIRLDDADFDLSANPTGISYLKNCRFESPQLLWTRIAELAIHQGFQLGIHFPEPETLSVLS